MKQEALIREDEKPLAFSHGEMSLLLYDLVSCSVLSEGKSVPSDLEETLDEHS